MILKKETLEAKAIEAKRIEDLENNNKRLYKCVCDIKEQASKWAKVEDIIFRINELIEECLQENAGAKIELEAAREARIKQFRI